MAGKTDVEDPKPNSGDEPLDGEGEAVEGKTSAEQLLEEFGKFRASVEGRFKAVEGNLSGIYSRQDKDRNVLQEVLDEFNALRGAGVPEAQARSEAEKRVRAREVEEGRAARLDSALEWIEQQKLLQAGKKVEAGATEELVKVLAEYGLDEKDPAVVPFFGMQGAELKAAVADLAFQRSKTSKKTTTTAGMRAGGETTTETPDVDKLTAKYLEEVEPLRGNIIGVSQVQSKYRKLGLNI
jgi:hypothetical protein